MASESYTFLGGEVKPLDSIPQNVGGVTDHVYLLPDVAATHRLADVVRKINIGAVIDYRARQDRCHRAKAC